MKLKVNGEAKEVNESKVISEVIKELNVKNADYVTVQLNDELIDRAEYTKTEVKENDDIEFIYFMGGGQVGF